MFKEKRNLNSEMKHKNLILFYWTLGWVLSLALVAFGPKFLWDEQALVSIIGVLFNLAIGVGMILANIRYINGLDELQRKIHLEAMALALGIAVVAGISYSMLDILDLIGFDAEISHLVIVIGLTYLVATLVGNARYQ